MVIVDFPIRDSDGAALCIIKSLFHMYSPPSVIHKPSFCQEIAFHIPHRRSNFDTRRVAFFCNLPLDLVNKIYLVNRSFSSPPSRSSTSRSRPIFCVLQRFLNSKYLLMVTVFPQTVHSAEESNLKGSLRSVPQWPVFCSEGPLILLPSPDFFPPLETSFPRCRTTS